MVVNSRFVEAVSRFDLANDAENNVQLFYLVIFVPFSPSVNHSWEKMTEGVQVTMQSVIFCGDFMKGPCS